MIDFEITNFNIKDLERVFSSPGGKDICWHLHGYPYNLKWYHEQSLYHNFKCLEYGEVYALAIPEGF